MSPAHRSPSIDSERPFRLLVTLSLTTASLTAALLTTAVFPSTAAAAEGPSSTSAASSGASSEAGAGEVVITEEARKHFRAGVNLLQDPDGARYAEAYVEFKRAYAESPSWKILGNLGIAAMKLERDGEAIAAFRKYLDEGAGELDETERAQFKRDLETLEAQVTWITLRSEPAGATIVDRRVPAAGQTTENRYEALTEPMRIGVRAGRHQITAELEGYEPATFTFDAEGTELEHTFTLKKVAESAPGADPGPPKATERPVPAAVWIGVAATGALTIGATVVGILALDKKSQFDEQNGVDAARAEELKSEGETLNLVTDVLIGTAVAAAGTTAVLYFTRPSRPANPATESTDARRATGQTHARLVPHVRLQPTGVRGGAGLSISGAF